MTVMPLASPGQENVHLQCADCGADDPEWASLNRAVLICTECCFIHRNLGRHVSQIRSLKKGVWETPQLDLVYALHNAGANRVWEHALLDPTANHKIKRKPTPNDPVFPVKEAFIKAKYVDHSFALRPNKDDAPIDIDDLNRQLWSCVRTSHVDTTLRLLALGADPNYADPERQNTPLHVAGKEGQALQVELLYIYGADPGQLNGSDMTPAQVAKTEGFNDLSNRLQELCFEVTNRLSLFLCGRKPDHSKQQQFLIPELTGKSAVAGLRSIRKQLQAVPSQMFEKIIQDVYDEVDRRETAAAWSSLTRSHAVNFGNEHVVAVFLPLNPALSATRNQLRQKLAKYDVREFATLVIDVLKEAKRRYFGTSPEEDQDEVEASQMQSMAMSPGMLTTTFLSGDGNRDYDEVADCTNIMKARNSAGTRGSSGAELMDLEARVSRDDVLELKEKVADNEARLHTLTNTNAQILKMVSNLQSTVEKLCGENSCLREEVARLHDVHVQAALQRRLPSPITASAFSPMSTSHNPPPLTNGNLTERASSMPKTTTSLSDAESSRIGRRHGSIGGPSIQTSAFRGVPSGRRSADHSSREREQIVKRHPAPVEDRPTDEFSNKEYAREHARIQDVFQDSVFPDNLIIETERLTGAIRNLLSDAQRGALQSRASEHAHTIATLIKTMISLVPSSVRSTGVEQPISELIDATSLLSAKCNAPILDSEQACHAAYNVAKAAKMLLYAVNN